MPQVNESLLSVTGKSGDRSGTSADDVSEMWMVKVTSLTRKKGTVEQL